MNIEKIINKNGELEKIKIIQEFDFTNITGRELRDLRRVLDIRQVDLRLHQNKVTNLENEKLELEDKYIEIYKKEVEDKLND